MTRFALAERALGQAPLLLLLGSGGLVLGALFFQYILGIKPCPLCHWQRYPHLVAIGLALMALASGGGLRATLLALIGLALLATAGLGGYHVGVEQKWWAGLAACEGTVGDDLPDMKKLIEGNAPKPPPRCDEIAWSFLGLSMAGWNVIVSLALAALAAAGARAVLRRRA
jgi:disulfide bond formation protein DsbB